jgi:hypothetical protein
MNRSIAGLVAACALAALPAIASAQATPQQAQADRQLAGERSQERAAYKTHNPAAIAQARAEARAAYAKDYARDHPENCARRAQADRQLRGEQYQQRAAYKSHNPAAIAQARAEARTAYAKDYRADHSPCVGAH